MRFPPFEPAGHTHSYIRSCDRVSTDRWFLRYSLEHGVEFFIQLLDLVSKPYEVEPHHTPVLRAQVSWFKTYAEGDEVMRLSRLET